MKVMIYCDACKRLVKGKKMIMDIGFTTIELKCGHVYYIDHDMLVRVNKQHISK